MIERRDFVRWPGLPERCNPHALFGLDPAAQWGEAQLGTASVPARRQVLNLAGYYRPTIYARESFIVLFEGMNPQLEEDWTRLHAAFGEPDQVLNWSHDSFLMADGEYIYARRGITFCINPANQFIVYVLGYAPTTAGHYVEALRPERPGRTHGVRPS